MEELGSQKKKIPLTSTDTSADPSSVSSSFVSPKKKLSEQTHTLTAAGHRIQHTHTHTHTHTYSTGCTEVKPWRRSGTAQSSVIVIAQQAVGHALPL